MPRNSLKKQEANIAISNTSPLIALKHAGLAEKLSLLFQKIIIPPNVMHELSIKEKEYFQNLDFLIVENPRDERLVNVLKTIVDEGEAEAIALALEKGNILIIDDLKGRKLARKLNLKIIGTLGLLKIMKLKGFLKEVKPAIEKLRKKGFYLSEDLVNKLLSDIGET